jgi:hypothetical protein
MADPADAQGRNEQRTPDLQLTNGMFPYADTDLREFVSTLDAKLVGIFERKAASLPNTVRFLTNRIANLKIDLTALLDINRGFDHDVNIKRIVLGVRDVTTTTSPTLRATLNVKSTT